ncbi:hypothetical protein PNOK_0259100 [Pyrrhoderma noxium]|uniref:DUF6534 domain-containing protein n=1 Tax=Pyrrhoderma noxium TaxID=2282107 RepID=A0A286USV6_9AGAM|nr:hypothetical protein PNOK_0259100 [Pyrrhoderma noxium]
MSSTESSNIDTVRTLNALFAGYVLSTVLYGLTFFQTYVFYTRFPRDGFLLRALVGILWALNTTSTALLSHSIYNYVFTNFGNSSAFLVLTKSICIDYVLSIITIFIIHTFMVLRIWKVSGKNGIVSGIVAWFSCASFAFGVVSALQIFENKSVSTFIQGFSRTWISLHVSFAFLIDIFVSVCLFFYLSPKRIEVLPLPSTFFESLVRVIFDRWTLITFIQLAYLLTYIPPAPNSLQLWTPFPAFLAGAYINAILALLNNRVADRDYGTGVWEEDLVAYVNAGGALGYGEQEGGALGITDRDRVEKGERSVTMGARDILNASSNEKARYGGRERDRSGVLEEGDVPPTPGSATMLLARERGTGYARAPGAKERGHDREPLSPEVVFKGVAL